MRAIWSDNGFPLPLSSNAVLFLPVVMHEKLLKNGEEFFSKSLSLLRWKVRIDVEFLDLKISTDNVNSPRAISIFSERYYKSSFFQ